MSHLEYSVLALVYWLLSFKKDENIGCEALRETKVTPHSKRISLGRTQDILTGCSDIPQ